ncbi:citrate synthase 2 [bacterium BMS3Bbin02]|nr:citrate synthase 2 [bacterium BMS3Bbin02]
MTFPLLTTAEAAENLGVKHSTVYAYVSRGLLSPIRRPGERASRFFAYEVESLRRGDPRPTTQGLVIDSAISLVEGGRYWYRGRDAVELSNSVSFEDVADILWNEQQSGRWDIDEGAVLTATLAWAGLPPNASMLQRIQAIVLSLAATDSLASTTSAGAIVSTGRGTLATVAHSLGGAASPPDSGVQEGRIWPNRTPESQEVDAVPSIAAALAGGLGNSAATPAVDQALGLLADHGLAPSTMAVRVAAGFGASVYQSILAGLATLSGSLHGGASGATERLFRDALKTSPKQALEEALRVGTIPGTGQPLYPSGDPRYVAIAATLRERAGDSPLLGALDEVERLCSDRGWGHPNVDMGLGALAVAYDLAPGAGEVIFAVGRMAGWIAHATEAITAERIRPRARYVGREPVS